MPMRKLIGLVRNLVVLIDGVGHGAAIVAWPTYRLDVALAAVNHNDPAFADETSMFSPLCDQFDAGGPLEVYEDLNYPAIRYVETVGNGPVTCLACLAINVDEWFPPETEGEVASPFGGE